MLIGSVVYIKRFIYRYKYLIIRLNGNYGQETIGTLNKRTLNLK